jgi:hypothetical protein
MGKEKQKSIGDEINDVIDSMIESKRIDLMLLLYKSSITEGSALTKQVVDGELRLLAFEYIHKRGIFKEKISAKLRQLTKLLGRYPGSIPIPLARAIALRVTCNHLHGRINAGR